MRWFATWCSANHSVQLCTSIYQGRQANISGNLSFALRETRLRVDISLSSQSNEIQIDCNIIIVQIPSSEHCIQQYFLNYADISLGKFRKSPYDLSW